MGLFGAYYAGVRTLSTAVLDSLEEPGGQITAMYPEKAIFDVAGFPAIKGRDLVEQLVEQAAPHDPQYLLGHQAVELERGEGAFAVTTSAGLRIECRAIVITGGIGTFTPRPLPSGGDYLGRGLAHFVPDPTKYAGEDVVVVGGGDSALDWALMLEPLAKSVTIVHRRAEFRAHPHSVELLKASSVNMLTDAQIAAVRGDPDVTEVDVDVAGVDPHDHLLAAGRGARLHRQPRPADGVGHRDPQAADRGRHDGTHDRPRHLRRRRHRRLRRQGQAHRDRLRRGGDRGEQRGGLSEPEGVGVPGSPVRLRAGDRLTDRRCAQP